MDISLKKKLKGQLPKPQPLKDLVGDYVAYQGQRDGSIPGRIDVYVKRANSTKIEIINDVPRDALQPIPPPNSYANEGGTWVLMAGPEGVPTYAEKLLKIMPQVFQRLAEEKKRADTLESKARAIEKSVIKTREEHAEDIAGETKKIANATKPAFWDQRPKGGSTSLTPPGG